MQADSLNSQSEPRISEAPWKLNNANASARNFSQFKLLSESLILAQDERWRRA